MVREKMMNYRMVIVIPAAAAILAGCGGGSSETTTQTAPAAVKVAVKTEPVQQVDFPVVLRFGGNLRGYQQTTIPARVTTTVTQIPVRVGQKVNKDDVLVMLDPGGVQSQYRQAEAVFRNAEKQWNKMKALYEAGAVSEMQLDGAETEYEVARANFNSARQSVEIQAPFNGLVADIRVRVGDEVAPGQPVVEVADVGSLRLLLEVPPQQAGQLKPGQIVTIPSPVDSTIVMSGTVFSIADAANQATRSFEVECHFPNPVKGFSPGTYVNAEIETRILKQALVIPSEALIYRSGKTMLYAVDNDAVILLTVTEITSGDGQSAVEGDLHPGQRVVVVGQKNLTPGSLVREAGI